MGRMPTHRPPTHPGEILAEEFLAPLGITQIRLAQMINLPFRRVSLIVNGKRGITADSALRLARLFGTTPEVWLNLQRAWDLYEAMHSPEARDIEQIRPLAVTG